MADDIRIETYTVSEIRDYLYSGNKADDLCQVISPVLAWSVINNPYASGDTIIMSATYVNDEGIGAVYLIPDFLPVHNKRVFWASTLWVKHSYDGKGYGFYMLATLQESCGGEIFDSGGVPATIGIFRALGSMDLYAKSHISYLHKSINMGTLKGQLAHCLDFPRREKMRLKQHLRLSEIAQKPFRMEYVRFVDDATYSFIKKHSNSDVFLRTREMLEWIINHPTRLSCPSYDRIEKDVSFLESYSLNAIKLFEQDTLVGFYIVVAENDKLIVKYLYYDRAHYQSVFDSLLEMFLTGDYKTFSTFDDVLSEFIGGFCARTDHHDISFSLPSFFRPAPGALFQGGDGDLFI